MPDRPPRRRRGPKPLDAAERRTHTVSARLNADELARLDVLCAAAGMQRGEYLRVAALHRSLPARRLSAAAVVPAINREAWAELARTAANLNQIARRLNGADADEVPLAEVSAALDALRCDLIGVRPEPAAPEDEGDESQG